MRKTVFALASSILLSILAVDATAATPTMRLDYYHTGNSTQEMFSLDRRLLGIDGRHGAGCSLREFLRGLDGDARDFVQMQFEEWGCELEQLATSCE